MDNATDMARHDGSRKDVGEPSSATGAAGSAAAVRAAPGFRWVTGSAGLVVLILVLAAIFDAISGNPIHSILLFGAAAVLVREELRPKRTQSDGLEVPVPP